MKSTLVCVLVVLAIYIVIRTSATVDPVDANDLFILALGRWAVMEHNKQANDKIKFNKVVSGDVDDAPLDRLYHLVIDAVNSGGKDASCSTFYHSAPGTACTIAKVPNNAAAFIELLP
ncbi:hypothetical protein EJB05_53302, partial [Eragrostis curvula]